MALFAALELEASALARSLVPSHVSTPGIKVYEGTLEEVPVVLGIGGVGKVAAAMTAQFLCDVFRPRGLVCFGLAGALSSKIGRGHVVVASGAIQHDLDARPITAHKGEIPGLSTWLLEADLTLEQALFDSASGLIEHPNLVQKGLVLTGDQIISATETRDQLSIQFPGAMCVDMETAAVAHVALQNKVPWGALRLTSDSADETFDLDDVLEFGGKTAADVFERIISAVMRRL